MKIIHHQILRLFAKLSTKRDWSDELRHFDPSGSEKLLRQISLRFIWLPYTDWHSEPVWWGGRGPSGGCRAHFFTWFYTYWVFAMNSPSFITHALICWIFSPDKTVLNPKYLSLSICVLYPGATTHSSSEEIDPPKWDEVSNKMLEIDICAVYSVTRTEQTSCIYISTIS